MKRADPPRRCGSRGKWCWRGARRGKEAREEMVMEEEEHDTAMGIDEELKDGPSESAMRAHEGWCGWRRRGGSPRWRQ
jgi:hypothetical protein